MTKYIHYFVEEESNIPSFSNKCLDSWKNNLSPDFELKIWSVNDLNSIDEEIAKKVQATNIFGLQKVFIEIYAIYKYGGIYVDKNLELIKDIKDLMEESSSFLGIDERHNINPTIWYEEKEKSFLATALYKKFIKDFDKGKHNGFYLDLPIMLKEILTDFNQQDTNTQHLQHDITVYGKDYFFPYSYDGCTKSKTVNTRVKNYIHYDYITPKGHLKNLTITIFGKSISKGLFKLFRLVKRILIFLLTPLLKYKKFKKKNNQKHQNLVKSALEDIAKNKGEYYVAFHNPEWTGVSNATIELFENSIPCGELISQKEINMVKDAILENGIKEIIFSGFCIGWKELAIKLHKNGVIVKTYFHGSHSQYLDEYGWEMNNIIYNLEKKGIVSEMAFCKESLIEFYKDKKCNTTFLRNLVNIDFDIKKTKKKQDELRVGVYAVQTRNWRKNVFSSLGAIALMNNSLKGKKKIVVDIVPKSEVAEDFMYILGIETDGVEKAIPRAELIQRMSECDINLYVTYSECAPMLPLESFYVDVPCITGNNHHYFKGTELEKYLVVNNENNPIDIKETIDNCLKNTNKVLSLYEKFSEDNLKEGQRLVKKFINSEDDRNE